MIERGEAHFFLPVFEGFKKPRYYTLSLVVPAGYESLYLAEIDHECPVGRSIEIITSLNEALQSYEKQNVDSIGELKVLEY